MASSYPAKTPDSFVSPLLAGREFTFVSAYTIYPYDMNPIPTVYSQFKETYEMEVTTPSGKVLKETFIRYISGEHGLPPERVTTEGTNDGITTILENGAYTVKYQFSFTYPIGSPHTYTATYTFQVVENKYPLKKQTAKEVIERILELAEPVDVVKNGENVSYVKPPRFHFAYKYPEGTADGDAERKLFAQVSPEFTFTNMTLRECLQEVGKFIQAEPRLRNGNEIIFDRYGEQKRATYRPSYVKVGEEYVKNTEGQTFPLSMHPYKGKRFSDDVGVACTRIESDVDNFVNRLDRIGGTIAEPYREGAISLRTETAYIRLEDSENLYFPTGEPIMDITSFVWVDLYGDAGKFGKRYDITQYIFEKTIYDAELSSYEAQYPRSKCYGLYFSQGEKHLRGFFFKNEEWSGGIYAEYAITNILRQVTNKPNLKIGSYPTLCFELVYTPIYGARLSHGKSYTGDMLKKPFTLMYNQSANVVETRYYGDHVKAVAERLGNMESTVSILIRNVGNLPQIGEMWDDDYYISTVTGSAVLDGVLVDIGLSKKFNRLSEYVGANSYKRYYEVSERMSQRRRTLYKDYLLITQGEAPSKGQDCFITNNALAAVANTFYQKESGDLSAVGGGSVPLISEIASCVSAQGFSKQFKPHNSVLLPVISSAFGNAMEFTWSFQDNYSAGISSTYQKATKTDSNGKPVNVSGYFGAEVTYGDAYGKAYYQKFSILLNRPLSFDLLDLGKTLESVLALPHDFDGEGTEVFGMSENVYRVLRKDSREILNQSYAAEFVTDIKNLIIGSALARCNPLIGGIQPGAPARLYVLQERVNQFSSTELDIEKMKETGRAKQVYAYESDFSGSDRQIKLHGTALEFTGLPSPVGGKAWAIITSVYPGEQMLEEDEDGKVEPVITQYGGELLLAWNGDIQPGDIVGEFKIAPVHDIFDVIK